MATASGTIRMSKKTAGHEAWLSARGYSVVKDGDVLKVEGNGFVETVDLTGADDGVGVLRDMVAKRQLATYRTRFTFNGGEVLSGIFAVGRLGAASALVVKASKPRAASASPYDGI